MKYYAVIDTNVLVIKEYREVLRCPKFHLTNEIIDSVVDEIERLGIYIDADELNLVFVDPKDRVFYEVVMEEKKSKDAYLITGNTKHFPVKPYVVTPKQMIDIIIGNMEN